MLTPQHLSNHASSLLSSNRQAAIALLRRAVSQEPTVTNRTNLAIGLMETGQLVESSQLLLRLANENPGNVAIWHAYGVLNLLAGFPGDASKCFAKCIAIDPRDGDQYFDYAISKIQEGDWVEGLKNYEVRTRNKPSLEFDNLPKWEGEKHKNVYVWAEQGIGDTLQFARYLPWLKSISDRVVFSLPKSLHQLFSGYSEVCEIVDSFEDVRYIDFQTPLMSLAYHYGTTVDRMPDDPNLLHADGSFVVPGPNTGRMKIGLCWSSNPAGLAGKDRSIPFIEMMPLLQHGDADFYSLQVGAPVSEITSNGAQVAVTDLSPYITDDWCKTAAAMKQMDFIVTVDTSVAHLAGILKVPTIMLLARRDCWRWGNEGTTTKWYPSMTIIRQKVPFSWKESIASVSVLIGEALQKHCAKKEAA